MNIYLPYPKSTITQRFGANANPFYAQDGLKGHPAYDWGVPYGTPVPNCTANAYCYSVMHKGDPVLMDYRAAFFIVKDLVNTYEISYGHLSEITAEVGKTYQVGEMIGRVGNTGPVYAGTHYVTETEKDAGSHAGAHLHGPQVRPVTLVRHIDYAKPYLMDATGFYKDEDSRYYEIVNYENGYNGCISLAPFSTETLAMPLDASVTEEIALALPKVQEVVNALPSVPQGQRGPILSALSNFLAFCASLIK